MRAKRLAVFCLLLCFTMLVMFEISSHSSLFQLKSSSVRLDIMPCVEIMETKPEPSKNSSKLEPSKDSSELEPSKDLSDPESNKRFQGLEPNKDSSQPESNKDSQELEVNRNSPEPKPVHSKNPRGNVLLLKTHKTASCTLQNVLTRYAINHSLFVGLSPSLSFQYESGQRFNREFVRSLPSNRTLNMLVHHMRFNKAEVQAVMPKDTTYITILRDPAKQFESAFVYYNAYIAAFRAVSESKTPLQDWFKNPKKYFRNSGSLWWIAKNHVTYDLGYDNTAESDQYITKLIKDMENTYDLVLIAEHLDTSLILLADLLNWDLSDMAYVKLNARANSSKLVMENELAQKIRQWNKADNAIYQHFNRTLWKRVETYGRSRLQQDMKLFKEILKSTRDLCIAGKVGNLEAKDPKLQGYNPAKVDLETFALNDNMKNNRTCQLLAFPETTIFNELRTIQYN